MVQAKNGDTVKVHYTGKFDDGTVFDSSVNREPFQFTIGKKQVIPGFEEPVVGMNIGEEKTVRISAEKAYGPYRDERVILVDKIKAFPEGTELKIGKTVKMKTKDGQIILVKVLEVTEDKVKVDANHPLAGKALNFDIKLVEIIGL